MQTEDQSAGEPDGRLRALFLAGMVVAFAVTRFAFGHMDDDAMITFTYARNLVEGNGFVFNPGERVFGTTAPWYGLFVAAGLLLGVPPWWWCLGADVLFMGGILWRIRQLFEASGAGQWFPLAALLLLLFSPAVLPVAGMETGLYMLAIFSALAEAVLRTAPGRAMLWGVLACMIRPDGVLVLGAVAPVVLWPLMKERNWPDLRVALAPMALLLVHAAVLYGLFGALVPLSLKGKAAAAAVDEVLFRDAWWMRLWEAYGHFPRITLPMATGLLVVLRDRRLLSVWLWWALYVAAFCLGGAPNAAWYHTPLFVMQLCFAAWGLGWLADRVTVVPPKFKFACALAAGLLIIGHQARVQVILHGRAVRDGWPAANQKRYGDAARWINAHSAEPPVVAAHEIGHLGYFLRGRIIDLEGLVTPGIAERKIAEPTTERLTWAEEAQWYVEPDFIGGGAADLSHRQAQLAVLRFQPRMEFRDEYWRTIIYQRFP